MEYDTGSALVDFLRNGWRRGALGWNAKIARVRRVLLQHRSKAEIWITETGYSTWRHDERGQIAAFIDAMHAPAERVYWYGAHDLGVEQFLGENKFYSDEREHHFGLRRSDGSEKLLFRLLAQGGTEAVENSAWLGRRNAPPRTGKRPVVITGGCGFIGCNLAHALCLRGQPVVLYDNLSRPGVERNAEWLHEDHGDLVQLEVADTRDTQTLARCVEQAAAIFHFAAQVAV